MPKPCWFLYQYDGKVMPTSKPFKTKEQAEAARRKYPERKYPEREREKIGIGVIRY